MSSANRDMAGERDKMRFAAIVTSNSQQRLSRSYMGFMSTNLWVIVQHRKQ